MRRAHPLVCRYGIPIVAVACALGLSSALFPVLQDATFVLLLVAVVMSAGYGQRIGGLAALVCGSVGSVFFHLPPLYSFRIADLHDVARLAVFVAVAGAMIWFLHSRQQMLDRLASLLHQATER